MSDVPFTRPVVSIYRYLDVKYDCFSIFEVSSVVDGRK